MGVVDEGRRTKDKVKLRGELGLSLDIGVHWGIFGGVWWKGEIAAKLEDGAFLVGY